MATPNDDPFSDFKPIEEVVSHSPQTAVAMEPTFTPDMTGVTPPPFGSAEPNANAGLDSNLAAHEIHSSILQRTLRILGEGAELINDTQNGELSNSLYAHYLKTSESFSERLRGMFLRDVYPIRQGLQFFESTKRWTEANQLNLLHIIDGRAYNDSLQASLAHSVLIGDLTPEQAVQRGAMIHINMGINWGALLNSYRVMIGQTPIDPKEVTGVSVSEDAGNLFTDIPEETWWRSLTGDKVYDFLDGARFIDFRRLFSTDPKEQLAEMDGLAKRMDISVMDVMRLVSFMYNDPVGALAGGVVGSVLPMERLIGVLRKFTGGRLVGTGGVSVNATEAADAFTRYFADTQATKESFMADLMEDAKLTPEKREQLLEDFAKKLPDFSTWADAHRMRAALEGMEIHLPDSPKLTRMMSELEEMIFAGGSDSAIRAKYSEINDYINVLDRARLSILGDNMPVADALQLAITSFRDNPFLQATMTEAMGDADLFSRLMTYFDKIPMTGTIYDQVPGTVAAREAMYGDALKASGLLDVDPATHPNFDTKKFLERIQAMPKDPESLAKLRSSIDAFKLIHDKYRALWNRLRIGTHDRPGLGPKQAHKRMQELFADAIVGVMHKNEHGVGRGLGTRAESIDDLVLLPDEVLFDKVVKNDRKVREILRLAQKNSDIPDSYQQYLNPIEWFWGDPYFKKFFRHHGIQIRAGERAQHDWIAKKTTELSGLIDRIAPRGRDKYLGLEERTTRREIVGRLASWESTLSPHEASRYLTGSGVSITDTDALKITADINRDVTEQLVVLKQQLAYNQQMQEQIRSSIDTWEKMNPFSDPDDWPGASFLISGMSIKVTKYKNWEAILNALDKYLVFDTKTKDRIIVNSRVENALRDWLKTTNGKVAEWPGTTINLNGASLDVPSKAHWRTIIDDEAKLSAQIKTLECQLKTTPDAITEHFARQGRRIAFDFQRFITDNPRAFDYTDAEGKLITVDVTGEDVELAGQLRDATEALWKEFLAAKSKRLKEFDRISPDAATKDKAIFEQLGLGDEYTPRNLKTLIQNLTNSTDFTSYVGGRKAGNWYFDSEPVDGAPLSYDAIDALRAAIDGVNREVNMRPALDNLDVAIKAARYGNREGEARYLEFVLNRVNGVPASLDASLDAMRRAHIMTMPIKQEFKDWLLTHSPTGSKIAMWQTRTIYMGALLGNTGFILKNMFGTVGTMGRFGVINTTKGAFKYMLDLRSLGGQGIAESANLTYEVEQFFLATTPRTKLFKALNRVALGTEAFNRGIAFWAGFDSEVARLTKLGKLKTGSFEEIEQSGLLSYLTNMGCDAAFDTQHIYGKQGVPMLGYNADIGGNTTLRPEWQFTNYWPKTMDMALRMLQEGEYIGFARFVMLTGWINRMLESAGIDGTEFVGSTPGNPDTLAPVPKLMFNLVQAGLSMIKGDAVETNKHLAQVLSTTTLILGGSAGIPVVALSRIGAAEKRRQDDNILRNGKGEMITQLSNRDNFLMGLGLPLSASSRSRSLIVREQVYKTQKIVMVSHAIHNLYDLMKIISKTGVMTPDVKHEWDSIIADLVSNGWDPSAAMDSYVKRANVDIITRDMDKGAFDLMIKMRGEFGLIREWLKSSETFLRRRLGDESFETMRSQFLGGTPYELKAKLEAGVITQEDYDAKMQIWDAPIDKRVQQPPEFGGGKEEVLPTPEDD